MFNSFVTETDSETLLHDCSLILFNENSTRHAYLFIPEIFKIDYKSEWHRGIKIVDGEEANLYNSDSTKLNYTKIPKELNYSTISDCGYFYDRDSNCDKMNVERCTDPKTSPFAKQYCENKCVGISNAGPTEQCGFINVVSQSTQDMYLDQTKDSIHDKNVIFYQKLKMIYSVCF